jgi:glycosyltransferase involved in cell wall biosynthesis
VEYIKINQSEQTPELQVAVDLRPLNYPIFTGVNVYSLHFLQQLNQLKSNHPQLSLVGIGLTQARWQILEQEFPFLKNLFHSHLSLPNYLHTSFTNIKALNGLMALISYWFGKYDFQRLPQFDYLFLLQPKPLWKHPETKQICIFHDIYSCLEPGSTNIFNRFYVSKKLYRLIAAKSQQVWSVSLSTAWDLVKFLQVPESKIKLVYSGKPHLASPKTGQPDSKKLAELPQKYTLALSGIEKRKNWHNLLLAHAVLQSQGYDHHLVLAGRVVDKTYYKELRHLIAKLNISRVQWILDPDETQKQKLLSQSLFVAYPSFYEGFGFPILEAFAAGKVVLTSRISSMPEIAKDAGLYVNPLNFQDIARGMKVLLTEVELKNKLEANISKNLESFSWSEVYQALCKTLTDSN